MAVFSAFNRANFYSSQPMDAWPGVMFNANGCVDALKFDEKSFTGLLAPEIGDLSEIRSIDMEENAIKGTIPSTIGNLTNLEALNLSDNQLEGNIPTSFVNLTNLNSLYLGRNNLSGSIPSNFNSLVELTSLDLADNQLSGCYDENLSTLCTSLSNYSSNYNISNGNNFNLPWEDFCSGVSCTDTRTKSPNQSTIEIDNFPNPFSGETTIGYNLPNQKRITLFVTDMMGKKVATLLNNEQQTKGLHAINFDGSKYPAGVYYYTLQAGDYIKTQKMILMK